MLRLGTLAGDLERETTFVTEIASDPELDLVLRCVDRVEALAAIRSGAVDAFVAVGVPEWFDFQLLEEARGGDIGLLGLASDPIEVERLEGAGFRVLSGEDRRDLAAVARSIYKHPFGDGERKGEGRLIAVWGPKGSPGRTTIAIELSAALGQTGRAPALIDSDPYGGDVLQLLGVTHELPGIVPLVRELARGEGRDPEWSARLHRAWRGGPALVPGLVRPELWEELSPFGWGELLKIVRRDFGFGVFDVGFCLERGADVVPGTPSRNEIALATVAEADHVIAVLRADPIGIKSFVWAMREYPDLLDREDVLVVANKVRSGEERDVKRLVRRYLGRPVFASIPDAPGAFARASWTGTPLMLSEPGGPVAEASRRLADAVGARVPGRGLLTRMAGGGRE